MIGARVPKRSPIVSDQRPVFQAARRADRVVALADVLSGGVCPDPHAYLAGLEGAAA